MIDDYLDVFKDELGQLPGEAHLISDPSVTLVRRITVSLTEKVKNKLDHLSAKKSDYNLLIGLAIWLLL